jgi:hypothetical protein
MNKAAQVWSIAHAINDARFDESLALVIMSKQLRANQNREGIV